MLPEGQWKLYGYTFERAEQLEPLPPDEEDEPPQQTPGKQPSSINGAEATPDAQKTNPPPTTGPVWTLTAQAMIDYKPVTVRSGQTAVMPFGPPYTPTVSGSNLENTKDGKRLSLAVRLVGSVGEICTSTTVNGRRARGPGSRLPIRKARSSKRAVSSMAEDTCAGTRGECHPSWPTNITSASR